MTAGLFWTVLAIAAATLSVVLIIQEIHHYWLDLRVSRAVLVVPIRTVAVPDMTGWLASLGMRYRRFYSAESLEELKAILQASGFNPHRALSLWLGIKVVSATALPISALIIAELLGKPLMDVLIFMLISIVFGIMMPRITLSMLKRRFVRQINRGTPDTIDLLVVCSEAGMGLESAVQRVAEEMSRSNQAMAWVLEGLLDDLRILPDRRDAFAKLGATSEGLRRFGAMVSQSLQYGTPLSQALRAIAEELRRESIIKLEERAHQLGAKLILPMVLFMLPAMFIILGGSSFLHLTQAFRQ